MSKALVKRSGSRGVVAGVASAIVPGVGQLINGETDKAIGVFAVSVVTGLAFLGVIPLLGSVAAAIHIGTRVYGAADGYIQGRKK